MGLLLPDYVLNGGNSILENVSFLFLNLAKFYSCTMMLTVLS